MELFNKYNMNFFKDSFEDAYMKFKEKNPRDALLKIFPYYTRSKTVESMLSKNIFLKIRKDIKLELVKYLILKILKFL